MKLDKYYTPELEEFHQGFEYEIWLNSAYTPEKYIKKIFEFVDKNNIWDDDITNLLACAYNGGDTLRVKYLDQEDIKSLGWSYSLIGKRFFYTKTGLIENVENPYNGLWLILLGNNNIQINDCRSTIHRTLYNGIIKNKSELKKLMKQLKIDE